MLFLSCGETMIHIPFSICISPSTYLTLTREIGHNIDAVNESVHLEANETCNSTLY